MQIGDKVKIGGTKYVVKAKGHTGYPQNSITLISEYIVQQSGFGSDVNYGTSTIKALCEQYYEQLSTAEQIAILETTRKIKNGAGQYPEFTEHIFILNSVEAGGAADAQMGSNIGFTNNDDRICTIENGAAQYWWLANASSSSYVWGVGTGGSVSVYRGSSAGVRPALNLSPTALLNDKDGEGYYSIVGADTISTLKDKSLNILGVKL